MSHYHANKVDAFREDLVMRGRSPATATAYSNDVRKFVDWAESNSDAEFGVAANQYINAQREGEMASASIVRSMSAIRAFRKFLIGEGLPPSEPFMNYKPPKRSRPTAHPLPHMMVDVDEMVRAAWRPHHKLLIGLCGYAGLRVSEARSVTPRSLYEDNDHEWWLAIHGKGGVYREVPVSDKLLALLVEYGGDPATPDTPYVDIKDRAARKAITEIAERAGIERPVSSHDLRHTFGTDVYGRTKDLRVTQELLGHASSSTTEGYTGVAAAAKRAAIAANEKVTRAQP